MLGGPRNGQRLSGGDRRARVLEPETGVCEFGLRQGELPGKLVGRRESHGTLHVGDGVELDRRW
jgi:hypothetical protein